VSSVTPSTLALHGGPKAVTTEIPPRRRWGEPELARLSAMVEQESLFYWNGPQTRALLEAFRRHYPLRHCMPCSSGSAALHIAVAALRLKPGDEVIVPAITDMGSVIGVLYQQLVPVFADVLADNGNLDPEDVRRRVTPRTRAVMPVHLAGVPCDMRAILALAREHGLRVIEDCAQAWGAMHQGRPVGLFGDLACYSFNEFKHLSCGDGGLVGTNDDALGRGLSKWGDKHYDRVTGGRDPETLSPNYRMSEPQAAVAAAQMMRHDGIVARRRELGERLTARLDGLSGLRVPRVARGDASSYWFIILRLASEALSAPRETIVAALQAEGVRCSAGYIPRPVYRYPVFQNHDFFAGTWPLREMGVTTMDYRAVSCPVAEALLADCLTCVLHEGMPDAYIDEVGVAFAKVLRHFAR
jgi:perosamine synthetase